MRLRFNKNANKILHSNTKYFFDTSQSHQCNPQKLFYPSNNPVMLEIGCGKGDFIINSALQYPEINFIALEKNETILAKAINKASNYDLNNLKFISYDANNLNELFIDHCFTKIFLNFSDPWPKMRHAKRRLTHPTFLNKYQKLLTLDGWIEFKTDNDSLYDYTYNEVLLNNNDKYNVLYQTTNLYGALSEFNNCNNIATEYEKKFHNLNKNIYKIVFNYK